MSLGNISFSGLLGIGIALSGCSPKPDAVNEIRESVCIGPNQTRPEEIKKLQNTLGGAILKICSAQYQVDTLDPMIGANVNATLFILADGRIFTVTRDMADSYLETTSIPPKDMNSSEYTKSYVVK